MRNAGLSAGMKGCLPYMLVGAAMLSSCDKPAEVVVTETRPLTTRDKAPKLFVTSDERFRDAKPSPVIGDTPESWLVRPPSQFRLLNYSFGESGMGEVWVSLSAGTILDNTNRWLAQFNAAALDPSGLDKLAKVTIAGGNGVWVEAAGDYASGMGAPVKPGFALAGVVSSIKGQILTVKMVGLKAEVEAARPTLETFVKSLKLVD